MAGIVDVALAQAQIRAGVTRRAVWQARYSDGKVISEWQCDWSLVPRTGLKEIRLVCPNGKVAVAGHTDGSDRIFQFKRAVLAVGIGRAVTAHVIGVVDQLDGGCQCAAWEPAQQRLVTFRDNVWDMQYDHVGRLGFDAVGIKP